MLDLSYAFFIEIYTAICMLQKRIRLNYLRGMHFSANEIAFLLMVNVFISAIFSLRFVDNDEFHNLSALSNRFLS